MFELLLVTSDYVAKVFSLRKGSSTDHYWEQLTLVSVKWPWDETVHLKFHENWPVWESSNWIFLASPLEVFVGSHQPSGQRFGIQHDSPNPNRPQKFLHPPSQRSREIQFSASNDWMFARVGSLVIEFQNGMKQPQNREVWTAKHPSCYPVLCRLWSKRVFWWLPSCSLPSLSFFSSHLKTPSCF